MTNGKNANVILWFHITGNSTHIADYEMFGSHGGRSKSEIRSDCS